VDPVEIPPELIEALQPVGLKRFVKVLPRRKKAFEKGCLKPENLYSPDDPELQAHLRRGGNYGVVGGRGLAILDTDDLRTEAIAQTLKPTFTVKTGSGKRHRYYLSDIEKMVKLVAPGETNSLGEIRVNAYALGPGSIHPDTGRPYTVEDPRPLEWISAAELRHAFKEFWPKQGEKKAAQGGEKRKSNDPARKIPIMEVIRAYGVEVEGNENSTELRGRNPTHGDNPTSFAVNPGKNVWRCHPCQSGGGPLELVALLEGIIECGEAQPGVLDDEEKYWASVNAAVAKGLVSREAVEQYHRGLAPDEEFRKNVEGDTLPRVIDIYSRLIRGDPRTVEVIYLHALSAYAPEPANLQVLAPTSEGKTYSITTILKYFPQGDVLNLGGLSPQALIHSRARLVDRKTGEFLEPEIAKLRAELAEAEGIKDKAEKALKKREIRSKIEKVYRRGIQEVDLENKILNILDKPNKRTLEVLKPLLSHDTWFTEFKIADKTGRGQLATKDVRIKGWPLAMVAATKTAANEETWAEIVSRFNTISPRQDPAKYRAAVQLSAMKAGLPTDALEKLLHHKDFEWLAKLNAEIKKELVTIKNAHTTDRRLFTPSIFFFPYFEQLGEVFPAERGRHMRDATRFYTILQMVAAANVFNRPRVYLNGTPSIVITRRDFERAVDLFFYGESADSILTGLPERVIKFYHDVFLACWEELKQNTDLDPPGVWVTTFDLTEKTREAWTQPLNSDTIRKRYLEPLEQAGFIDSEPHPHDKRKNHYRPLFEKNGNYGILRDAVKFDFETLKEAIERLQKIRDEWPKIIFRDFQGRELTIEELWEKWYSEKSGSLSRIDSGEKTAPPSEKNHETAESRKIPQNPEIQPPMKPPESTTPEAPPPEAQLDPRAVAAAERRYSLEGLGVRFREALAYVLSQPGCRAPRGEVEEFLGVPIAPRIVDYMIRSGDFTQQGDALLADPTLLQGWEGST